MPHWDFRCDTCGFTADFAFSSFERMEALTPVRCQKPALLGIPRCTGQMQRQAAAPSSFNVKGFSEINGYASPVDVTMRRGGMKVQVKGNPEILRDGTGR